MFHSVSKFLCLLTCFLMMWEVSNLKCIMAFANALMHSIWPTFKGIYGRELHSSIISVCNLIMLCFRGEANMKLRCCGMTILLMKREMQCLKKWYLCMANSNFRVSIEQCISFHYQKIPHDKSVVTCSLGVYVL